MMKICYIGDGESVHNHYMIDWFCQKGHDVFFLTDTPHQAISCPMQVVAPRHQGGPFRHLYAARQCRKWIRRWQPNIVHAHILTGYGYWGALSGFSPLVLTSWGSDVLRQAQASSLVRWLVSYSVRQADLVTADAQSLCQATLQLARQPVDVRLLQWGVDLAPYEDPLDEKTTGTIRQGSEFVIVSTRRLRPLYNIDVILRAYAQVVSQLPSSRLIVVGEDIQKVELVSLSRSLGIEDHVHFTGWIDKPALIAILRSADLFVSVPSSDSTALSLLEAMAAGLPAVVSDLPANREWIQHQENGLCVDAGSVDSLAKAILQIADNRKAWKQKGLLNRQIIEQRGNRENEMRTLETWYQELLDQKKKP